MKKPLSLDGFVIATLRRASYRWKARTEAMGLARVERGRYKCAQCGEVFGRKEIQVDHILPIVPTTGWDGWEGFIARLFCSAKDLQILCKKEHALKTKKENEIRRDRVKRNITKQARRKDTKKRGKRA